MSWFSKLFSAPEGITTVLKGADKLVLTKEEHLDIVYRQATVLGPQNIARRYISVIVTLLWTLLTLTMAGVILGQHPQLQAFADFYTKVSLVFGGIMTFYFGAHVLRANK
jgi:hypothetical protein